MSPGDLRGLSRRLDQLPSVECAAYHTEPTPWVEVVVADDRLGPLVLLMVATHRVGVAKYIPAGDGQYRSPTLR